MQRPSIADVGAIAFGLLGTKVELKYKVKNMHESTIDNVKLELQPNSNSKDDGLPSSPNDGNTIVVCSGSCQTKIIK